MNETQFPSEMNTFFLGHAVREVPPNRDDESPMYEVVYSPAPPAGPVVVGAFTDRVQAWQHCRLLRDTWHHGFVWGTDGLGLSRVKGSGE